MTVLITGGSHGIGLELSRLFARDGHRLLIVSKPLEELERAREQLLSAFPGLELHTLQLDLSLPDSPQQVYDWTRQNQWDVDLLVNNAGFGTYGFINDIDMDKDLSMIRLHVLTLYALTRLFLRDMLARNRGQIVNISSISAYQPNPFLATYGATKSFVLQFSRAIDRELRDKGSKVRVMAVCPSPVKQTGFQSAAGMDKTNTFDNWMVVTPDIVARDIYKGIRAGRSLVIPGLGFGLLHKLIKRLPERWVVAMSKQYLRSRE